MDLAVTDQPAGARIAVAGVEAVARPSGALWLPHARALVVADLHLGKSERMARRGGALLPPYETGETLRRLSAEIAALVPEVVVSVGDAFDDDRAAAALTDADQAKLAAATASRRWLWVSGNHDPRARGGAGDVALGGLTFRHIAKPEAAGGEVSGHWHPKATLTARGRRLRRPCFLLDGRRLILPAFGAYTGGLCARDPVFDRLLAPDALALLTGRAVTPTPRTALSPRAAR